MSVKKLCSLVAAVGLSAFVMAAPGHVSAANAGVQCETKTIPVTLSPDNPTVYHVVGRLCYKGFQAGKTVQVLEHGTTNYKEYWDFPLKPQKYSYVRDMAQKGYVTLALDTFGAGESDRPPADEVTLPANAFVLHQVVQKLRDGSLSGTVFTKVMLVGHSSGSGVSVYEAATYGDVDGVVLSGLLHDGALPVEEFSNLLHPAGLDPKFATTPGVENYFTTKPGVRGFFFNTDFAKPEVIAQDEALKGTVSVGDLNTFFLPLLPGFTNQINVPVLLVVGQTDKAFCNPDLNLLCNTDEQVLARESTHYDAQACLEAKVQLVAAHNLNLHPNANVFFSAVSDWTARRVGNGAQAPTQPC